MGIEEKVEYSLGRIAWVIICKRVEKNKKNNNGDLPVFSLLFCVAAVCCNIIPE
jgi:hypothetical protein